LVRYVNTFQCDIREAEVEDLTCYKNLGEFFRRNLKTGVRPICQNGAVVRNLKCSFYVESMEAYYSYWFGSLFYLFGFLSLIKGFPSGWNYSPFWKDLFWPDWTS